MKQPAVATNLFNQGKIFRKSVVVTKQPLVRVSVRTKLDEASIRAAIGGAGLVGVINFAYGWYKDRRIERQQSRATAIQIINKHLEQPYKAPPMGLNMPFLPRPGLDELRARLKMDEVYSITVIEGPSKSGKSTTVQQLINGRTNTVYINIREKTEEIPILVAEAFGAIGEKKENLKDLALGTVTGLVKSALMSIYEKREYLEPERKHEIPVPLCIIDDIQSQIQGDDFNARIKAMLFWFLEMANHSLIKLMLLTSDRRIISVLENMSGFSQRCDVVPFSYVYTKDMQKELVNMNFSEREAAHIVKFIGGHLGHVQDFLQTMKIANGKLLVREGVEQVVAKSDDKLLQVLLGDYRGEVEMSTWLKTVHGIFIALSRAEVRKDRDTISNHEQKVNIADISEQLNVPLTVVAIVAKKLASLNLLRYFDPVCFGYYCPIHFSAYASLVLKEKAVRLQYIQAVKIPLSDAHNDRLDTSGLRALENTGNPNQMIVENASEKMLEENIRSVNVAEQNQNANTTAAPAAGTPLDATNYAP